MGRLQPLVRIGLVGLPLMTAACSSGESLGLDASDPNCVLLCALTRSLTGEAPKPPQQPPSPPVKPKASAAHHATASHLTRPHRKPLPHPATPDSAAAPEASAPPSTPVPEKPASSIAPAKPAPVPPPPNNGDLGQQPAAPQSQGQGQSIPGSATIIQPLLQGQ